jgi:hypothetical protein
MKSKHLAIVVAAVALTVAGAGVVFISRNAAPAVRDHDAADKAIEQLLRMDARFEAGINLMVYSQTLADVLFAVDTFEASGEAAQMPGVAASIYAARAHYQWAARVWPMRPGSLGMALWELPNKEDAALYFGPTPEESIAAVQEVRDRALALGSEDRPFLADYVEQLVPRVLARAGDLGREARRELQSLTAGGPDVL